MQNFILVTLIIGLGFFLYLIQTGEINYKDFGIQKFQEQARFEIVKSQTGTLEKSSTIMLNIKGIEYNIYTFTGNDFKHVPKSEYYMKAYNIPLEAKDAVTGTWLGYRYVFFVAEESVTSNGKSDVQYSVYKTEYSTDSQDSIEYKKFKTIHGFEVRNTFEVLY